MASFDGESARQQHARTFEEAKVGAWLNDTVSIQHSGIKRKRALQDTTSNPKIPIKIDIMEPTKKSRRPKQPLADSQHPLRVSPRKKAGSPLRAESEESPERGRNVGDCDDLESQSLKYANSLRLVGDLPHFATGGSTKSRSSVTRSTSPVKTTDDLAMAEPPITFVEASSRLIQPPELVSQLRKELLEATERFGLLPSSLKDAITPYCETSEGIAPRAEYFQKHESPSIKPSQDELDTWEAVKRIHENARKCSEDGDSEAGWGEMVYSQILEASLRFSPYKDRIGWKNITAARVEPKSLGPKHLSGKMFGSKMVDYAIFILPDDSMHRSILQVLRDLPDEDQNINQTRSAPVRYRPITVNIEVKVPGEGKNEALVQLAVWTASQMNKLNDLSGKLATIQIPQVLVEGHDWRLYEMYQEENTHMRVWGNIRYGDSTSVIDIYRAIAGNRILAKWSDTVYRDWFEREVLKL